MRAGKNVWMCSDCNHEWKSEEKPSECPKCASYLTSAKYPDSRVRGEKYEHYVGQSAWEQEANQGMSLEARNNFNK